MTPQVGMADDLIWGRRPGFWAGVLILGTTAARLAFIASGQLDLVQDEAQYWDWSRRLQASYFTKGPLIAWIIALWTKIFGVGAFGVRFGAVIGSAAIQLILYLGVGRLMQRPLLALLSLVVANTTLLFMVSGVLMTTDNPLLVFWFGALFCLYWGSLDRVSRWPFVLLIPCLALGTLAKYMMLAFVPTALLYAFLLGRAGLLPKRFGLRLAASLVLGVSLGLLPILLWNFANDFVGFRHIFHLAGVEGKAAGTLVRFDRFPDYMGSQVALVLPWWFVFMLLGAWRALKTAFARPQRAVGPDTGLDFRQACVFACGFWPMWGFFLLWSFHTKILANWSAVSYASGVVLAGAAFEAFVRKRSFKGLGIWLWPLLGCVIFGAVHVHDLLPVPYRFKVQVPFTDRVLELENPSLRLKGWTDLGAEIERFRQSAFKRPDRVFVFADNYDMTAALAFHVPGRPRTFCVNVGRRLNQYDLWPGPDDKVGWDAIYVRQKFKDLIEPGVAALFAETREMHYQTMHKGRPARKFTIYLCYGFKGPWPRGAGTGY